LYYETSKNDHGLPFNPFKAIVSPRPIGWISSRDADGKLNLAPYSFFNAVSDAPPTVMFASSGWKDSAANIEATGEFVCNFPSHDLKDQMNTSSAAVSADVSEFELAGLETAPSRLVSVPRVAAAPAALECRVLQVLRMNDLDGQETNSWVVFGQVVAVHIDDTMIRNGRFDVTAARPLSRLGYKDYAVVEEVFEMDRPTA